jgi:hypothetical protein
VLSDERKNEWEELEQACLIVVLGKETAPVYNRFIYV